MNQVFLLLIPFIFLFAWLRRNSWLQKKGRGERILIGCIYGGAAVLYLCAVFNYDPWMPSDMYNRIATWFTEHYVPDSQVRQ